MSNLASQVRGQLANSNVVVFRLKRPSGKDLEMMYPSSMFHEDFDGTMKLVEDHLRHWMDWCDSQQVCPLKK